MSAPKNWRTILMGAEFKVMRLQEPVVEYNVVDTPERIRDYLVPMLPASLRYNPDVENMGVVFLTTRRKPIGFEIISNGTLDTLLVHAREIFKPAIVMSASAIVLFHNHPSGDPTPSEADVRVTRDLFKAGQLLKIEVLDHIILGRSSADRMKDYASLRELGYFFT